MGIRQKQRAVIEFVVLGGKSPINIFRILKKIRGVVIEKVVIQD